MFFHAGLRVLVTAVYHHTLIILFLIPLLLHTVSGEIYCHNYDVRSFALQMDMK